MNAGGMHPAPSDTIYKKVCTKLPNVFEQLNGSPCQRMLQDDASRNMPAIGIELLSCLTYFVVTILSTWEDEMHHTLQASDDDDDNMIEKQTAPFFFCAIYSRSMKE
jgi:hypothetical protein